MIYTLWVLDTANGKASPFGNVDSREPTGSAFSPDGRWVAYASTPQRGGASVGVAQRGVYIQPFPATGARYQVPRQILDFHPLWGRDGRELFMTPSATSTRMVSVSIGTQPTVEFGTITTFPARVTLGRLSHETRTHDILPDGRFIGLIAPTEPDSPSEAPEAHMRVVLNWFEERKQRVSVNH